MPYLQITIPSGKSEAEAKAILTELRDTFPLRQSQGRFLRMTSYYILFEQPEHTALTMEQVLWLEQHGYEDQQRSSIYDNERTLYISFLEDRDQGCRNCNHPFDDAPSGYCSQCHTRDPYKTISFSLQFSPEEYDYMHNTYLAHTLLTLVMLLEKSSREQRTCLLATDRFHISVQAFTEECKRQNKRNTFIEEDKPVIVEIILSHQEYQKLHTVAEQLHLDISATVRLALSIPEIQIADTSLTAATGSIFSCDTNILLTYFEQEYHSSPSLAEEDDKLEAIFRQLIAKQELPQPIRAILFQNWRLAKHLPLCGDTIFPILSGISQRQAGLTYLGREKMQLQELDRQAGIKAVPCSPEEITLLEQAIQRSLPAVYTEFLAWMGHGAGDFMCHLDCFYPSFIHFQQAAHDLLAKDASSAVLSEDAFVFFFQAEQGFAFFRTSEGDNPPIYTHRRDWRLNPFRRVYAHFSDFLAIQVALYAEYVRSGILISAIQSAHLADFYF
ncbi:hypothetical protein KSD_31430 [Ktedonobacter sp. SOSP1-85]|uniref:SMI1/KNR4 family protein n=1 Tax=Ktedonobacter sp. SOSP1-85 TaxID=2778367 RepID=UPI001915FDF7|nr:SMI1/KNR4 family protein [Ktedonobacter sp. SOSP1-85]GHO75372.1 hypothetical protein KSD_31430 [Ktedonobacter sp. SOSP1-85]